MKIVDPDDRVTLVLNKYLEPFAVCTARATIKHLVTGKAHGIDAADQIYPWSQDVDSLSDINWERVNVSLHDDQPALRSSNKTYAIPTIIRCNNHFGIKASKDRGISLRRCYKIYKGVCQYCLKHIPYSEATKDHCYPKSRGGSNDDFNIVLACRKCNNKKGSQYPILNVLGKDVKPRISSHNGVFIPDEDIMRSEWKKYLFLS